MIETISTALENFWGTYTVGFLKTAGKIIAILLFGKLLHSLVTRITKRILQPREGSKDYAVQLRRAQTLKPLLLEIERYTIYFLVAVTILAQVGIDTGAILASVGVVGIALGFGAQNLVKDMIAGFFLLFDGLVAAGDIVKVDDNTSGTVEAVGIRNTQVRDFSGLLWIIPNGDLRQFGNFNRGWMRAVVPIQLAFEEDVEFARATVLEVAQAWVEENQDKVIEPPEVQGLMAIGDTSMGLRLVIKMKAMEQWAAERELRARIKRAFDQKGIEIPYPRRVVYEKPKEGRSERGAA